MRRPIRENAELFLDKANDDFQGGRPDGAHIVEVDGRKLVAISIWIHTVSSDMTLIQPSLSCVWMRRLHLTKS